MTLPFCPKCNNRNVTYAYHLDGVEYFVCLSPACGNEFPVDVVIVPSTATITDEDGNVSVEPFNWVITENVRDERP